MNAPEQVPVQADPIAALASLARSVAFAAGITPQEALRAAAAVIAADRVLQERLT